MASSAPPAPPLGAIGTHAPSCPDPVQTVSWERHSPTPINPVGWLNLVSGALSSGCSSATSLTHFPGLCVPTCKGTGQSTPGVLEGLARVCLGAGLPVRVPLRRPRPRAVGHTLRWPSYKADPGQRGCVGLQALMVTGSTRRSGSSTSSDISTSGRCVRIHPPGSSPAFLTPRVRVNPWTRGSRGWGARIARNGLSRNL